MHAETNRRQKGDKEETKRRQKGDKKETERRQSQGGAKKRTERGTKAA